MRALYLFSLITLAAVLQAVLPAWPLLGEAKPPLLAAVIVYYALARSTSEMLWAAMLAGLMQDGLGLIPFGYSSFTLCALGWVIMRYKEMVFVHEAITHLLFGLLIAAGQVALLWLLLSGTGLLDLTWKQMLHKAGGGALLGMLVTPPIFRFCGALAQKIGLTEESESVWHEIF